ncbi:hypothetical protein TrCOL_g6724 [Triparma columacea]|uniref:Cilia- and flagella-associated protein 157 n=1 Tax=Triparma columacea TaxID=722753 RepID=A0A9W7G794_9STRA|nr:hypothetical protein TrCOL_g6724 [Triparma columacea]
MPPARMNATSGSSMRSLNSKTNFSTQQLPSLGGGVAQLESELDSTKNALKKVNSDLIRSRESYVRRERAYKTRIDELEDELQLLKSDKASFLSHDKKMVTLKRNINNMQRAIEDNVDIVQDRTTKILQEQERDLLRAFRARLFDVQTELEQEKSRTDNGATEHIDKLHKAQKHLEKYQNINNKLDEHNRTLIKANETLQKEFDSQNEDRNYLIQKLVEEKRRSARLAQECERTERENQKLVKQLEAGKKTIGMGMTLDSFDFAASPGPGGRGSQRPGTTGGIVRSLADTGADNRYKEIIKRLKRLLETERVKAQKAKDEHITLQNSKTEMEKLLRDSIEDVRDQIRKRRKAAPSSSSSTGKGSRRSILGTGKSDGGVSVDDFTSSDRERVLELLFAKERVITLLQIKAFPPASALADANKGPEGTKAKPPSAQDLKIAYDGQGRPQSSNNAMGKMGVPQVAGGRPITAGL